MEGGVRISLEPLEDARWVTHEATGARFKIAALDADRDNTLTRECRFVDGQLDMIAFAHKVAARCVLDWQYVGDKDVAVPCNPENLARFMKYHAITIGPWIIRQARSLDHFRREETEAAKNA